MLKEMRILTFFLGGGSSVVVLLGEESFIFLAIVPFGIFFILYIICVSKAALKITILCTICTVM